MTWEAFGAIFQAIGAIATAIAVIVALWQTKYANKKRLKLTFSVNGCIYGEEGIILRFVMLSVCNIGNRSVVLRQWGFILGKKYNLMVVADSSDKLLNTVNHILPQRLQPEESSELALRLKNLEQELNKVVMEKPRIKKKRVKVFAVDSTGKVHKKRTSYTVEGLSAYMETLKETVQKQKE